MVQHKKRGVLETYREEGLIKTIWLISTEGPKRIFTKISNPIKKYTASPEDYHQRFSSDNYTIHERYQDYGMDETSDFIHTLIEDYSDGEDIDILELGCNMGRHLNKLYLSGYLNLYGIEINDNAIAVLEEEYPDLADQANIYNSSLEDQLSQFSDGRFDVIFSITVLELIHSDNDWVFEEIARVTNDILIIIELEEKDTNKWTYEFREYKDIFCDLGFKQVLEMDHNEAPIAEHLKERPHMVRVFKKSD